MVQAGLDSLPALVFCESRWILDNQAVTRAIHLTSRLALTRSRSSRLDTGQLQENRSHRAEHWVQTVSVLVLFLNSSNCFQLCFKYAIYFGFAQ